MSQAPTPKAIYDEAVAAEAAAKENFLKISQKHQALAETAEAAAGEAQSAKFAASAAVKKYIADEASEDVVAEARRTASAATRRHLDARDLAETLAAELAKANQILKEATEVRKQAAKQFWYATEAVEIQAAHAAADRAMERLYALRGLNRSLGAPKMSLRDIANRLYEGLNVTPEQQADILSELEHEYGVSVR